MPRTSAAQKKAAERADLKTIRAVTVTLTLEATEEVLQRLAALMLLQDPTKEPFPANTSELPWEPQPTPDAPPLELDYNAIRNDILKRLPPYVEKNGKLAASCLIQSHGGENLKAVPDGNLMGLLADLEAGCE